MHSRQVILARLLDVLLFLSTLAAVAISFMPELPDWAHLAVLMLFMALFGVRWYVDRDRTSYLKANWLDLALVVLLASPALRLLMALKIIGLVPAMKIGTLIRMHRKQLLRLLILSSESFPAAISLVFVIIFVFGVSAYLFEHAQNAGFTSVSDGLWWAIVTLTTVGYGDIVPQTAGGRIVGVLTMIFGIMIYSLLVANLTRYVEQKSQQREGAE